MLHRLQAYLAWTEITMYGVYRAGALHETSPWSREPGDVKATDSALLPDSWWMITKFTAILPESFFRVFNTYVYIGRPRNGPYLEVEELGGLYFVPKGMEVGHLLLLAASLPG